MRDTPASPVRRQILAGAASLLAALKVAAADAPPSGAHDMHKHAHGPLHSALTEAALACMRASDDCVEHCLMVLKMGDSSLGECADLAAETSAACAALAKVAASNSPRLPAMAKACIVFCTDCEKACREQAREHAICDECADMCQACIKECEKVAA